MHMHCPKSVLGKIKGSWLAIVSRQFYSYTVGRIKFEDKKFRGFRGCSLNLEIKYPRNFLHTIPADFFVQHVHVVGKQLALWK